MPSPANTLPGPTSTVDAQVAIAHSTPSKIELSARLGRDGYLVLLDNYYPGWYAEVDGQPAEIMRVHYFAKAVFLPVGQHFVRFAYRPWSFYGGANLALLGLAGVVGAVFWQWFRNKNGRTDVKKSPKFS